MARYISAEAPSGWRPRPGELVAGKSGKRLIVGSYLRTRQVGRGCVLAFVRTQSGREVGVNEIKPNS